MAATRQPVNIFLASSAELDAERKRIEQFISRLNGEWADDGIILDLRIWEDADHGGSLRSQDDYNRDLAECGIFLMLFYSKVGKYTREEFEAARKAHVEEGGLPKLFVFRKYIDLPRDQSRRDSDSRFDFLDLLNELGNEHFPILYENLDELINKWDTRLRRLRIEGFFGPDKKAIATDKPPRFLTAVPRPDFFTGREVLLADLHQKLKHDGAVALVRGIGGIGKTTAALAYLHRDEYGGTFDHVAWLEISTTLPEAFAQQKKLHEKLDIRPRVEELLARNDLDGIVRLTLDALDDLPGPTLLALDNANDRDEVKNWKPALRDRSFRLLLTSRADIPNVTELLVGELDPADAAALFWHHYRPNAPMPTEGEEANAVAHLLSEVQYHTLLIEILSKIGKQAGMSVADLVKHVENGYVFSDKLQRTVATGSVIERKDAGLDESTLENLVLFLFKGLAPGLTNAERGLLRQIAVLPPTAHAPKLLARLFGVPDGRETDFFNALDGLDKRGVPLKKNDSYQLHRLVRAVALHELKATPKNCAAVLGGVTDLLRIDQTKDNPVDKFPFVGYGEALLNTFGEADEQHVGVLQNELAIVYWHLGDYGRARSLLEAFLASTLRNFDPDHPTVALIQSNLASIYRDMGKLEWARDMLEATLASALRSVGPNDPTVARRQSNLAVVYRMMGEYDKARDLLEAALASDLNNFGPNDPTVARRQSNLAIVYRHLGDHDRARGLLKAALASDLRNFTPDHLSVGTRHKNLAEVEVDIGNWKAAKEHLDQALVIGLQAWSNEHPKIQDIRQSLAFVEAQLQKN